MQTYDLVIIGGGINGTAIAADAAGRGLSVLLCEKDDLSSGTSSTSTKLIHGGLRYLEHYEFNVVRKALHEREILMRRAPNLIKPLEFVLPYEKNLRPAWMIRLGLFLYDHLTRRRLIPRSTTLNFKKNSRGNALRTEFTKGFSYYDCFTDDARLVVLNALSAKQHGANIKTRTAFIQANFKNNHWEIELKNLITQEKFYCNANVLINAAGPWVAHVQQKITPSKPCSVNLVKGSHIIIPKLYDGDFAYILECPDKRVIFTIPYMQKFTLIGTTDLPATDLEHTEINADEKKYLCDTVNHYFKKNLRPQDIVWSYAGVRCLQAENKNDLAEITRDYQLLLDGNLLTVIGGKLTTHRLLAEDVLHKLKHLFPHMKPAWTANTPLPGGDFNDLSQFTIKLKKDYPWLPAPTAERLITTYGSRAYQLLANTHYISDLGLHFGADLYQKEIEFLIEQEWAITVDDILWRRTKLGLFLNTEEIKKLETWTKERYSTETSR